MAVTISNVFVRVSIYAIIGLIATFIINGGVISWHSAMTAILVFLMMNIVFEVVRAARHRTP